MSIVLPTFNRPEGLARALRSLCAQDRVIETIEIIVADNDPQGSARTYVEGFPTPQDIELIYLHVPEPGVANARNGALASARGRYLAFLDDDQIAEANWLQTLLFACKNSGACLAFSPTVAQNSGTYLAKSQRLDFFHRAGSGHGTKLVSEFYGCGNSLLDRGFIDLPVPPFDLSTNETGGEDDQLFSYLRAQGGQIVWTDETHVCETVDDHRMALSYIALRSFAYGQGNSRLCTAPNPLNLARLMRSVVTGSLQWAVYGLFAIALRAARRPQWVYYLRKASEGLGKVLWMRRFRPRLYGQTALNNQKKRQAIGQQSPQALAEVLPTLPMTPSATIYKPGFLEASLSELENTSQPTGVIKPAKRRLKRQKPSKQALK